MLDKKIQTVVAYNKRASHEKMYSRKILNFSTLVFDTFSTLILGTFST